jgi:hypothetical protein
VSTFENMVICVEILLSLDIFVKYAQCVKIWMFLNCVHFPEILCSVSGEVCLSSEEKDNVPTEQVSRILVKGDTRCEGTSPFYLICTQKRKPYRLFSKGMVLAPARGVAVGSDTPNVFVPTVTQRPGARSSMWSTSCLKSLKQMACHGFKS